MDASKLQVKVYAESNASPALDAFVPVFHRWIRDDVLDELMLDVADYSHVHQGPGVVLIGHGSDYYFDTGEGRPGLLYSRKREAPASGERLLDAFRRALSAAALLEKEEVFEGSLRFRGDELLLRVNDRLRAINSEQSFEALRPELDQVTQKLFGNKASLTRIGDPRDLLTIRVQSSSEASCGDLLARVAS